MIIGFTGTRNGMTDQQCIIVTNILIELNVTEIHHGGCDGSDEQFHNMFVQIKPSADIVIHPGNNKQYDKVVIGRYRTEHNKVTTMPIKPYLERNKDIVNASDIMIATPKSVKEELRSGTWATIRYAKKNNKKVFIVEP